jgi:hypothetical protein
MRHPRWWAKLCKSGPQCFNKNQGGNKMMKIVKRQILGWMLRTDQNGTEHYPVTVDPQNGEPEFQLAKLEESKHTGAFVPAPQGTQCAFAYFSETEFELLGYSVPGADEIEWELLATAAQDKYWASNRAKGATG